MRRGLPPGRCSRATPGRRDATRAPVRFCGANPERTTCQPQSRHETHEQEGAGQAARDGPVVSRCQPASAFGTKCSAWLGGEAAGAQAHHPHVTCATASAPWLAVIEPSFNLVDEVISSVIGPPARPSALQQWSTCFLSRAGHRDPSRSSPGSIAASWFQAPFSISPRTAEQ